MELTWPLSHSSITTYEDCPAKWHFRYIQKVPQEEKHFFSFGKSMHSVMEFVYALKAPPSLDEALKFYKDNWLTPGYQNPTQELDYYEQGKRILREYYKVEIPKYKMPLFNELPFIIDIGKFQLKGFIDRVDELPDGRLGILDYKTGKTIPKNPDQLTTYQLACERKLGKPVGKRSYYQLSNIEEIPFDPASDDELNRITQKVIDTGESIEAEKFTATPSDRKCKWCDYRKLCPDAKKSRW